MKIVYPHRGEPPPIPEGYERDPTDPYILIPVFVPCKHREKKTFTMPCGKCRTSWFCNLLQENVNQPKCEGCEKVEET